MKLLEEMFLDYVKPAIQYGELNWTVVIFGSAGSGKTNLASILAFMIDENFGIEKMALTSEEFLKALCIHPTFSSIVLDEGGQALHSRKAMSIGNIEQVRSLMQVREGKYFFTVICVPDLMQLDSYVRNFEARTIIETYFVYDPTSPSKFRRGFCNVYHEDKIMDFKRDSQGKLRLPWPSFSDTFPQIGAFGKKYRDFWAEYKKRSAVLKIENVRQSARNIGVLESELFSKEEKQRRLVQSLKAERSPSSYKPIPGLENGI